MIYKFISRCVVLGLMGCSATDSAKESQELIVAQDLKPQVYEIKTQDDSQAHIHIYPENQIWYAQKNIIASDGFPDRLEKRHFSTYEAAYEFAQKKWGINDQHRLTDPWDRGVLEIRSTDGLWKAQKQWTWQDEVLFSQWIQKEFKPDFFVSLGIANDCADVAYQLRMIYAREHGLPVAFRLSSGGAWFTQNTMRADWKKLKTDPDWRKDKRFLKAIDYVADQTYTHTLARDVYPVEITPESLIEGTIHLSLTSTTGHTMIANEVNPQGSDPSRLPLYVLYSNVPKIVRPLYETFFFNSEQPQKNTTGYTGFVRFRWPKTINSASHLEATAMPHFSEEQYSPNFVSTDANFSIAVFKRINPLFEPVLRVTEGVKTLKNMILDRKQVVADGFVACQKGCKEGSASYEDWSTPSRDKRILELFLDIEKYVYMMWNYPQVSAEWLKLQDDVMLDYNARIYKLKNIFWTFKHKYFNSDPNVEPSLRWGIEPQVIAKLHLDKIYELIRDREKALALNKCVTAQCPLFSKDYFLNSTAYIDGFILNSIPNDYCTHMDKQFCIDYEQSLAARPSGHPLFTNGLQLVNSIDELNFDPRLPTDKSWGESPFVDSISFDATAEVVAHTDSLVLVAEYQQDPTWGSVVSHIYWVDIQLQKKIFSFNANGLLMNSLSTNSRGDVLGHSRSLQKVFIIEFQAPVVKSVPVVAPPGADLKNYYYQIRWHASERWSYENSESVLVFELQNSDWILQRDLKKYTISENIAYRLSPPSEIAVVFLDKAVISEAHFDVGSFMLSSDLRSCTFEALDSPLLLGTCFGGDAFMSYGKFILDSQAQQTHKLPQGWPKSGALFGHVIAETVDQTVFLYAFDSSLAITEVKKTTVAGFNIDGVFVMAGKELFIVDQPSFKFEKIAEVPQDTQVSNLFDNFVVVSSLNQEVMRSSLIDLSSGQSLLTAPTMSIAKSFPAFYPWLRTGWQFSGELEASMYVKYFEVTLDLQALDAAAVTTKSFLSQGAPKDWTQEEIKMMSLNPIVLKKFVKPVKPKQQDRPLQWLKRGSQSELIFK